VRKGTEGSNGVGGRRWVSCKHEVDLYLDISRIVEAKIPDHPRPDTRNWRRLMPIRLPLDTG
jgi:hypothetical protein